MGRFSQPASDIYEERLRRAWVENTDGAHDLAHIHRVWANVRRIAKGEGGHADMAVLRPATVFHDLVNVKKDADDRSQASLMSADAATQILEDIDFPQDKIEAVRHAIIAHSFSAGVTPETIEAKILQDADRLDALGAIGIARTMYVAGSMNRWLYHLYEPLPETRTPNDIRYALDHFENKLLNLAETMQTATGRAIAEERSAYMREFLHRIQAEIGGAADDDRAPA